jgi:phytoene dehydrogenase-like protein
MHRAPFSVGDLLTTRFFTASEKVELAVLMTRLSEAHFTAPPGAAIGAVIERLAKKPAVREALHALVRLSTYAHGPALLDGAAGLAQLRQALTRGVLYLDEGWEQLIRALVIAAGDAGAALITERRVERISEELPRRIDFADGETCTARAVILALGPFEAHAIYPALNANPGAMMPARAACLDVGLEHLPRPDQLFALGIDTPTYFSVHSAAAHLAPKGHALVHVLRYIGPHETPHKTALIAELEAMMDLAQPGWRAVERARQFLPMMMVAHDIPRCATSRARVDQSDGLFLAGDWVGDEAMLSDCAAASARKAASGALQFL